MDVESDQSESPNPISEADFVRLFARHELALRNYARLILPDWSGVDDVLQDASITMWESRQRLRAESGFLPWGKVIVRHKCFRRDLSTIAAPKESDQREEPARGPSGKPVLPWKPFQHDQNKRKRANGSHTTADRDTGD